MCVHITAAPSRLEWREEIVDFGDFGEELVLVSETPRRARRLLGGKGGRRFDSSDRWDSCERSFDRIVNLPADYRFPPDEEPVEKEGGEDFFYGEKDDPCWEEGSLENDYDEEPSYWSEDFLEEELWDVPEL
jgi:hypothetical protein